MDIAGMSIGMSQAKLAQEVSMSVMKMAMDSSDQRLTLINDMANAGAMERSVNPHIGSNIDIKL